MLWIAVAGHSRHARIEKTSLRYISLPLIISSDAVGSEARAVNRAILYPRDVPIFKSVYI